MRSILLLIALVLASCERDATSMRETSASATALPSGMTRVAESSEVCMVNDPYMARTQIPVDVHGCTYYACCPACRSRLIDEPASRTAKDPTTGRDVDKSSAIIVRDPTGGVRYFESENAAHVSRIEPIRNRS
jgi:hypothetical protein